MKRKGNSFGINLKESHLNWGTYRKTNSRIKRSGEGYLPIPRNIAKTYCIFNSNGIKSGQDTIGINLFNAKLLSGNGQEASLVLKAQGSSKAKDRYAKQFSEKGNLRTLGTWYKSVGAKIGDVVQFTWVDEDTLEVKLESCICVQNTNSKKKFN